MDSSTFQDLAQWGTIGGALLTAIMGFFYLKNLFAGSIIEHVNIKRDIEDLQNRATKTEARDEKIFSLLYNLEEKLGELNKRLAHIEGLLERNHG